MVRNGTAPVRLLQLKRKLAYSLATIGDLITACEKSRNVLKTSFSDISYRERERLASAILFDNALTGEDFYKSLDDLDDQYELLMAGSFKEELSSLSTDLQDATCEMLSSCFLMSLAESGQMSLSGEERLLSCLSP